MGQYVIRRVILAVPVILGILIITFAMAKLIPGDPCTAALGEHATKAACAAYNERMGLADFYAARDKGDWLGMIKALFVEFTIYMRQILFHGDFGNSLRYSRPVSVLIIERLPLTIELGTSALFLAVLIGVPAGIVSAVRRNSTVDVATMIGANIGVSMPVYWLGLMLAFVFAIWLKGTPFWLAPTGRLTAGVIPVPFYEAWGLYPPRGSFLFLVADFISNFTIFNAIITGQGAVLVDAIRHLILPALALSTIPLSIIARITRSSMLDVLGREYVRAARAKGVAERLVIFKHALRNALLPVVTVIGIQTGTLFAGAVLTETTFGLSGVGRALFDAITGRDFAVIQGFTVVVAIGYVAINLLVDISYAFIDPRIRLS